MCYLDIRAKPYMTGTSEFQSWLKYLLMSCLHVDNICQHQKVSLEPTWVLVKRKKIGLPLKIVCLI